MKVEWVKQDGSITDVTEVVTSVTWSGSTSQAGRTAEITILNAPNDKNIVNMKINMGAGDAIKLYEDDLIFLGEIQNARRASETGTITYSCYDLLNHLLKSTGVYNFSDTTAENITEMVCADIGISVGNVATTGVLIKKMIIDGDTFYDIIMKAYTKAAAQNGKKYICRIQGTTLSVEEKGTIAKNFKLAEGKNITNTEWEESIENMVNIVKVFDENGIQIGEVKNEEWIKKYGVYQQICRKESGADETAVAKNMLQGVENRIVVDGIGGNLDCIAGNGVEVFDVATGLSGLFWIESDSHVWENGVHTMNLELDYKNIMDSKESSEGSEE